MRAVIAGLFCILLGIIALVPGAGYRVGSVIDLGHAGPGASVDENEQAIPPWVGAGVIVGGLLMVTVGAIREQPGRRMSTDERADHARVSKDVAA
jgi:hypothetical protein